LKDSTYISIYAQTLSEGEMNHEDCATVMDWWLSNKQREQLRTSLWIM